MVLGGLGPTFVQLQNVTQSPRARRATHAYYYDRNFANVLFREALLSSGSFHAVHDNIAKHVQAAGSEMASLLPGDDTVWLSLLADTFYSPATSNLLQRMLRDACDVGEWNSVSVDCTYRVCMPL
eukprot:5457008-Karenia_brevis.AAC.1